jgi:hypothetical protein
MGEEAASLDVRHHGMPVFVRRTPGIDLDDRPQMGLPPEVLPDGEETTGLHPESAVRGPRSRKSDGVGSGGQAVDALVPGIDEVQNAIGIRGPRAATVFVHP